VLEHSIISVLMKDIIKAYQQDSTEEQKKQLTEVKE
jgi:hypothetical protein